MGLPARDFAAAGGFLRAAELAAPPPGSDAAPSADGHPAGGAAPGARHRLSRGPGRLIRKPGLTRASAASRAVMLIERFGSALNLNIRHPPAGPRARPFGQPSAVQIGNPADLHTLCLG
jgi:hypothetical protein